MTSLESDFLSACRETILRQGEMVPLLAGSLGMAPERVFHHWVISRPRPGRIGNTAWMYFFHGLECELENREDGRFLRVAFGPGGRYDCLSVFGVMQFVMCSRPPWKVYPELRRYLSRDEAPADQKPSSRPMSLSGSHKKLHRLIGFLDGHIERIEAPAAPVADSLILDAGRPEFWDRLAAHRLTLSERDRSPA